MYSCNCSFCKNEDHNRHDIRGRPADGQEFALAFSILLGRVKYFPVKDGEADNAVKTKRKM